MRKLRQQWARFWTLATHPRQWNWLKVSMGANFVILGIVVIGLGGMEVIHQSDTNPQLCRMCHIMSDHVDSYLHGTNLDSVHAKANVECKDCHDYPIPAEIRSGINFITGNYYVEDDGSLVKMKFGDEMCLQCHISTEHVANQTDYLVRNPHLTHITDLQCGDCHISHGQQVDTCSECHENGGQRMVGGEIIPRADNPWANPDTERPDVEIEQETAAGS
jgi:nitrate/TMAO reductase-like tetraheme cytochrome c subunit